MHIILNTDMLIPEIRPHGKKGVLSHVANILTNVWFKIPLTNGQ